MQIFQNSSWLTRGNDAKSTIVITNSEVDYLAPVDGDFTAECLMPEENVWERFLHILQAKGKHASFFQPKHPQQQARYRLSGCVCCAKIKTP